MTWTDPLPAWVTPLLLALVTAQRLGELVLARRNTARLKARGAVEHAPEHYPLIVLFHAAWLAGLWGAWALGAAAPASLAWLIVYLALQGLRAWTLLTLRGRWTTRILVVPGETLVRRGPYRFVPHPNYMVVAGEILVLPLALGLVAYAVLFSLAHAAVLALRLRAESRALASLRG